VRGLRGLALLALTVGLSGCAAGPDYSPFSIPTPISFLSTKDGISAGKGRWSAADLAQWWRSFHDPELNSLVARAAADLSRKTSVLVDDEALAHEGLAHEGLA